MTNYSSIRYAGGSGGGTTVYADMNALIAATGSDGAQAFVQSNNNIYVYSGSGWYKIATVQNDSPSAITGVSGSYGLAMDGTPTVITAVSTDPEGFPLTWTYSTSGLGSIATVSQADNVFTITPSTDEANVGTFTLTINATDGVNGAVSTNTSITLQFQILNSKYTTLLATAVDTSNNSSFTDSSTNNHSISVNGDAHAGTFSPYRHGGYSTYFDGNGDYLNVPYTSSNFGTSDFTLEAWVYNTVQDGTNYNVIFDTRSGATADAFVLGITASGHAYYYDGGEYATSTAVPLNQWAHLAIVRSGSTVKIYQDGVEVLSRTDSSNLTGTSTGQVTIGRAVQGIAHFNGYLSDLRIVKGTAVYTSAFTPPTERLTAVTNTSLLICHLPYIADDSSNDHSITVIGNTSTKPFSPYDYSEYSASDNGGSVRFDGSGDSLNTTATQIIPSTSFTVTAWVYLNDTTNGAVWGQGTSGHSGRTGITIDANKWFAQIGSANLGTSTSVSANRWYYTDLQWDGSTLEFFVDGTSLGSIPTSNSPTNTAFYIGDLGSAWSTGYPLNGYVSDLKVVSGTPSGSSTVPTSPQSSSGASLHIKGTDASIIDKSQGSNLKLVGNTTGSTTQVKFADTKSMYFDGSGDYIGLNDQLGSAYGTGDFTVEGWVYLSSAPSNYYYIWAQGSSTSGTNNFGVYYQSNVLKVWHNGGTAITGTNALSLNTWHHVALSREGTSLKLFLDGTQEGSTATNSSNITSSATGLTIARWAEIGDNGVWTGYISDFRVTKGLARYTANFTPPTASLEG